MALTERHIRIIRTINRQIAELRRAKHEALTAGVSNVTLSSAGNSQSFARWKPEDFDRAISNLQREKSAILRGSRVRTVGPDFN